MKTIIKKIEILIIPLVLVLWGFLSFYSLYPPASFVEENFKDFSISRTLSHVNELSKSPHYIGSDGHSEARNYIINELESYGLEVHTQTGISYANSGVVSIPQNIIAKIPGTDPSRKALLLLSHYDSAVHSSHGAADAGSGVASILESVRFFLASGNTHTNDIIICLTDGEEIGLNGAYLFTKEHPWAKDVGLVLNFEARGASGPSNMLLETNSGNAKLVSTFKQAKPRYPVANSLMYSIYKLMPNDTDSTVFREEIDIPSFFFAFIDNHYIYHTELDNATHLDEKSLRHQASYLLQLIPYYANIDLEQLSSKKDLIYFDFPFVDLLSYPFSWSFPIWLLTLLLLLLLFFVAQKKGNTIQLKYLVYAFLWHFGFLVIVGSLSFFLWDILRYFYPHYDLFLQGFTYNGHLYIFAFATLGILLSIIHIRHVSTKYGVITSSVAGHTLWLILLLLLIVFLNGASFFIIPLIFSILVNIIQCYEVKFKVILQLLLTFPIVVILLPIVQSLPVGLGLKFLFASTISIILLCYLVTPLIVKLKQTSVLYAVLGVILVIGVATAHVESGFTEERPRPSTLVYIQSNGKAFFATYETQLSNWSQTITNELIEVNPPSNEDIPAISSKRFQRFFEAPFHPIEASNVVIDREDNVVYISLFPTATTNRVELFLDEAYSFKSIHVNGKEFDGNLERYRFLLSYYVVNNEPITIALALGDKPLESLDIYETSYQLVPYQELNVPERPKNEMAMPFVTSDAIIKHQKIVL